MNVSSALRWCLSCAVQEASSADVKAFLQEFTRFGEGVKSGRGKSTKRTGCAPETPHSVCSRRSFDNQCSRCRLVGSNFAPAATSRRICQDAARSHLCVEQSIWCAFILFAQTAWRFIRHPLRSEASWLRATRAEHSHFCKPDSTCAQPNPQCWQNTRCYQILHVPDIEAKNDENGDDESDVEMSGIASASSSSSAAASSSKSKSRSKKGSPTAGEEMRVFRFQPHLQVLSSLHFDPLDDSRVYTASHDSCVRLMDINKEVIAP